VQFRVIPHAAGKPGRRLVTAEIFDLDEHQGRANGEHVAEVLVQRDPVVALRFALRR
jgi:hypothetical protein